MRIHHAEKSIERWMVCDLHIIPSGQPRLQSALRPNSVVGGADEQAGESGVYEGAVSVFCAISEDQADRKDSKETDWKGSSALYDMRSSDQARCSLALGLSCSTENKRKKRNIRKSKKNTRKSKKIIRTAFKRRNGMRVIRPVSRSVGPVRLLPVSLFSFFKILPATV